MTPTSDLAIALTLELEGGLNKNDEGSESWYGIRRANHPNEPWPPTKERARTIARDEYWTPYHFDLLPPALACAAFDWIYNGGPAIGALQRLVGVRPDGAIGPVTAAAVRARDPERLLAEYLCARTFYLMTLSSWPRNGRGWMQRLFTLARRLPRELTPMKEG